ncbi:MAG: NotI family restriction endonuclease [Nitrospirota bacterium]|nr:NotI family restriction endonuclease [Nitrospirota bacterium]
MTNPLAEVFGFPINNIGLEANRSRDKKLCPYNNKVPNCTKDKATDPLGVCSIFEERDSPTIICPIRFRQDWIIAEDAANFLFPKKTAWTSLTEVRLKDGNGQAAGNIDVVLVSYDSSGKVLDFGSLEVQAVYISGNIRNPFNEYLKNQTKYQGWEGKNYPRADYLSSSRKRLAPQMIYKGGIFKTWEKKQAVALHKTFYSTLPELPEVSEEEADIAWLLYDLVLDEKNNRFNLSRYKTIYTKFGSALQKITTTNAGQVDDFMRVLQEKLDEHFSNSPPDAPTLQDMLGGTDQ